MDIRREEGAKLELYETQTQHGHDNKNRVGITDDGLGLAEKAEADG